MLPASAALLCTGWLFMCAPACSKPVEEPVVVVDTTRPPVELPTGVIKEFIALDTLIGYGKGSSLRWNVTETNSKTVVYLEGTKVTNYGSAQTGALQKTTSFLLTVNSGKTASAKVTVADSLTTMLWNEGRRWRLIDALSFETQSPNGQPVQDWYSHFKDSLANQRAYFYLDGTSKEVNISPNYPQPKPSGKYVTNYDPARLYPAIMTWKGKLFLIDTLTDMKLTMTFDSVLNSGFKVTNRVRYKIEY